MAEREYPKCSNDCCVRTAEYAHAPWGIVIPHHGGGLIVGHVPDHTAERGFHCMATGEPLTARCLCGDWQLCDGAWRSISGASMHTRSSLWPRTVACCESTLSQDGTVTYPPEHEEPQVVVCSPGCYCTRACEDIDGFPWHCEAPNIKGCLSDGDPCPVCHYILTPKGGVVSEPASALVLMAIAAELESRADGAVREGDRAEAREDTEEASFQKGMATAYMNSANVVSARLKKPEEKESQPDPELKTEECPSCGSHGVRSSSHDPNVPTECSRCKGKGRVVICPRCDDAEAEWRGDDETGGWLCDDCIAQPDPAPKACGCGACELRMGPGGHGPRVRWYWRPRSRKFGAALFDAEQQVKHHGLLMALNSYCPEPGCGDELTANGAVRREEGVEAVKEALTARYLKALQEERIYSGFTHHRAWRSEKQAQALADVFYKVGLALPEDDTKEASDDE